MSIFSAHANEFVPAGFPTELEPAGHLVDTYLDHPGTMHLTDYLVENSTEYSVEDAISKDGFTGSQSEDEPVSTIDQLRTTLHNKLQLIQGLSDAQIKDMACLMLMNLTTDTLFTACREASYELDIRTRLIDLITPLIIEGFVKQNMSDEISDDTVKPTKITLTPPTPPHTPINVQMPKVISPTSPTRPISSVHVKPSKSKISWAASSEKEDEIRIAYEAKVKKENEERAELLTHLPWSQRLSAGSKTLEQLRDLVNKHEKKTGLVVSVSTTDQTKSSTALETHKLVPGRFDALEVVDSEASELKGGSTKRLPLEMYGKAIGGRKGLLMVSIPPKKVVSDEQIEDIDDGWTPIVKADKGVKPLRTMFSNGDATTRLTGENTKPEKVKTVTSAKWFFPVKPIIPEDKDFHLWDYDANGLPYGWYHVSGNKWMIHSNSQFVHTHHTDRPDEFPLGYWTHEEQFTLVDKDGSIIEKTKAVSVPYLTFCLTPVQLRRHAKCPEY